MPGICPGLAKTDKINAKACLKRDFRQPGREFHCENSTKCSASTAFFRNLLIDIPEGAAADLGNEPITSCPIMLWVVGVPEWDLGDLLVRLGLSRASLEVVESHEAFVILRKQP